jgi:catechol-2,3-dioxygenase
MRRDGIPFDRAADHDIAHAVYLRDADGNQIEMYSDTTKNWRDQRTGTVMTPTIRWTPDSRPPTTETFYVQNPEIRRVESAVFHPRRVTHVALVVADFENCLRRYTDVVGLKVMARRKRRVCGSRWWPAIYPISRCSARVLVVRRVCTMSASWPGTRPISTRRRLGSKPPE